jgi:hypothetical protein
MPWFLDSHTAPEGLIVTLEDLAEAHARDVAVGEKYAVRYGTERHRQAPICVDSCRKHSSSPQGPNDERSRAPATLSGATLL